jgi:hypothetical protein
MREQRHSRTSNSIVAIWRLAQSPLLETGRNGTRVANFDLFFALWLLAVRVFYVPRLLRHRTSIYEVISERPMILKSICRALSKEQSNLSPEGVTLHSPEGVTLHSPEGVTLHSTYLFLWYDYKNLVKPCLNNNISFIYTGWHN